MSLVNDALKKARLEAARGDAANRSIPYPLLGRGEQSPNRVWIGALFALILLIGLGGFFLFRAGRQSALQASLAEPIPTSEANASIDGGAPGIEGSEAGLPAAQNATASGPTTSSSERSRSEPVRNRRQPESPQTQEPRTDSTRPEASRPRAARNSAPSDSSAAAPLPRTSATPNESSGSPPSRTPAASAGPPKAVPPGTPGDSIDEESTGRAAPQEFLRQGDVPGVGSIELGGIAWSGDRPFALINGRVVRPGDTVSGLFVDEIQPNSVRLRGKQGALVFRLK